MKENMLDMLMYIFTQYMNADKAGTPDSEAISAALEEAGFESDDIISAFQWLQEVINKRKEMEQLAPISRNNMRIFVDEECKKLSVDCRRYLLFLEQAGVISPRVREQIIMRAMDVEVEEVSIDQLKLIALLEWLGSVSSEQSGEEILLWLQEMVHHDDAQQLH